jgi:hypothetical protein
MNKIAVFPGTLTMLTAPSGTFSTDDYPVSHPAGVYRWAYTALCENSVSAKNENENKNLFRQSKLISTQTSILVAVIIWKSTRQYRVCQ